MPENRLKIENRQGLSFCLTVFLSNQIMSKKVLVVGGAGYIGSHGVKQLELAGYEPVVLDNLCLGHRKAVAKHVPFYQEDLGDYRAVRKILKDEQIDIVMHFAAFALVGESVNVPLKYYHNNVTATLNLLQAMIDEGVKKFVFSSTCATYGEPESLPIVETLPQSPINPYGQTKLDIEKALSWMAKAHDFSFAAFRYFNAAGAAEDASIGEDHKPETHLIPIIFEQVMGKRDSVKIFGTDYDTPDGTCLRDYVHVDDLVRAHIASFDKLAEPKKAFFYNLGTGTPCSVREIIQAVEKVTGKTVVVEESARRPGDPAALYANSEKAVRELGWDIQYKDVESLVASAWKWHSTHPNGYDDEPS